MAGSGSETEKGYHSDGRVSETGSDFSAKVSGFGDSSDVGSEGKGVEEQEQREPSSRAIEEEGMKEKDTEDDSESDTTESSLSGGYLPTRKEAVGLQNKF